MSNYGGGTPHLTRPTMLPYRPCMACYRGDASRVLVVDGDQQWMIAALVAMAAFSSDDAVHFVTVEWPNWKPSKLGLGEGRRMMRVRLCLACSEKASGETGVPLRLFNPARQLDEAKGAVEVQVLAMPEHNAWRPQAPDC